MNKITFPEIDHQFTKRALLASFVMHAVFLLLKLEFEPIKYEERKDAIVVTIAAPEEVIKNKMLKVKSDIKEVEKPKELIKEKVVTGTQKVIPKAKELGNPKAEKVQKVQKGDPMSKDFSKYKPGTDFQKLKSTNIGTGSSGSSIKTDSSGGSGDTYKGLDFAVKSTTNNAPLGQRFKIKSAADDMGAGAGATGGIGNGLGKGFGDGTITGTRTGTLEKAKILTNVGSLTGATEGKIAASKGSEGLARKGAILLSGMPEDTVVLGSMDPNLIRQILLQYVAQFRYCYQSELDRTGNEAVSGVVNLNFDIGSAGQVTKTNVQGPPAFEPRINNCISGVLRGIQFPEPKGGGTVQVKQPLNLYPKKL